MNIKDIIDLKYSPDEIRLLNNNFNNRNIDHLNIIEVPKHLYKIEENSFILINNHIFEKNNLNILDTVELLNTKNISAIGIICNKSPLEDVKPLSKNLDYPIFLFSHTITFGNIIRKIIPKDDINEFFSKQFCLNLNILKNSDYFTMDNILNLLANYINRPLILFSENFEILNYLKPSFDIKKRTIPLDKINNLVTSGMNNPYSLSNQILLYDNEYYILYPLKIPQKNLGFLCLILEDKGEEVQLVDELANVVIPHIIINMLTYHKGQIIYKKTKDEFIHNLLYGLYQDKNFIKAQGDKLQLKYNQRLFVWILKIHSIKDTNDKFPLEATTPNNIINKALNIAKSRYPEDYSIIDSKGIIFIQKKDDTPDPIQIKNFSKLIQQLELYIPEYKFSIGISRYYESIDQLKYAYNDAVFSLKIGSNIFKDTKNIYPYNDLIIYHLIDSLEDNPIIERIYNITIKKIIKYDEENNTVLLETLKILIDHNFKITETADTMFVHRNTLYKRMDRLADVTGYNLENSQSQLLLQLGLKIHDIYFLSK